MKFTKLLSILLSFCLLISLITPVFATDYQDDQIDNQTKCTMLRVLASVFD